MSLTMNDHWMWDHWICDDGKQYHLFFLRASRALQDPERRHWNASMGHAVSTDARSWALMPDALVHSDGPAFDDQAIWTGSTVVKPDGSLRVFYTGISRAEGGMVQRVGLGSWDKGVWNVVSHFILPSCALAFQSVGTIARFTRSSMLEVLRQDYIRTAYAKGLRARPILERHALRNALIPVVTVAGLQLGHLLAGAVLTESIFALPGLGKLMVDAIMRRDFLLVQGEVLVIALLYLLVNFLVDLLYALLNPKIRKSFGGA